MHAMVFHCYVVTSISSNFQDALDVTFQETFQSTSRTLWMLRCKIQFEQLGKTLWMLRSNSHFNQLLGHYGCYVVLSSSSNLEDASDATFQQQFQSTSRTLWMLRCTIHCYVVTSISSNFQDALDVTFQEPFQSTSRTLWMLRVNHPCTVTSSSSNLEDASDATFQEPFQSTSRTLSCYGLPFLRCKIHLEQLRRRFRCYLPRDISIKFLA